MILFVTLFIIRLYAYINIYKHIGKKHGQDRSSHPRCSVREGVLRNFAKFTEKHLCQSLFFNKVARLRPATLKETLAQVFSCEGVFLTRYC